MSVPVCLGVKGTDFEGFSCEKAKVFKFLLGFHEDFPILLAFHEDFPLGVSNFQCCEDLADLEPEEQQKRIKWVSPSWIKGDFGAFFFFLEWLPAP